MAVDEVLPAASHLTAKDPGSEYFTLPVNLSVVEFEEVVGRNFNQELRFIPRVVFAEGHNEVQVAVVGRSWTEAVQPDCALQQAGENFFAQQ